MKKTEELEPNILPSAEQLSFSFDEGEVVAPVSAIYKKFIYTMMKEAITFGYFVDGRVYNLNVMNMKDMLKDDDLFKKTSKQFQKEVHDLLDLPFETMYKYFNNGKEYSPRTDGKYGIVAGEKVNLKSNRETKLRVVK